MRLVPSIDLVNGRSRLVFWPGAASGTGTPTDRPERIATAFVGMGAQMIHLVDLDGARQGVPVNTAAIAAEWLGVKQVVPMHWGTFPLLTGTPAKLKEQLAGKQIEVLEMKAGETAK